MDKLKKFFPTAFMFLDSVGKLILGIVLHFVVGVVLGTIFGVVNFILGFTGIGLIIAIPISFISFIVGAYLTACIVIAIIAYVQNNKK